MGKKKSSENPESNESTSNSESSGKAELTDSPQKKPSPVVANSLPDSERVHKTTISQYISLGLLLAVIALFSFLFYEVMAKFLVPLFLAALLVVVFRPIHNRILEKCGGREKLSALLTTAVVLIVVLAPISILLVMAAAEGRQVIRQFNSSQVINDFQQVRTSMGLDKPSPVELRTIDNEINELQKDIVLSEADNDRHRTGLYIIHESAKSLAQAQNLEWPDNPPGEETEKLSSQVDWGAFVTSLQNARSIHSKLNWGSDETDHLKKQRLYQVHLGEIADSFGRFRTQLLGGKTRAWIIQLANPTEAEADAYISDVVGFLKDKVLKLGGAGAAFLANLLLSTAIMIIGLYFFLLDGPKMIKTFKGLSPIDDAHEQELIAEFSIVSRAVVLATLLSALAQGLLAGIGFYFAGLDSVFLLTVLSAVLAMVPFVGAASVWIPCALYLYFVDNSPVAAIGLAVYGASIISMADNVIKPFVLHGQSNIHPLLALLSVLGGVTTLGPIGILVGPMVVAFLQTLLKILQREMTNMDRESNPDPIASPSS